MSLFLSGGAPRRPMERAELLELAQWWSAHGVAVLPVRLVHNAARDVVAKMPAGTVHGFEDATLEREDFEKMLDLAQQRLEAREALALGGVPGSAGFAVGDFDTKGGAGGATTLRELLFEYPDASVCRYRSASGALNCWWRKPHGAPSLRNATVVGWHGFELRSDAGFVVLPGAFSPWGAWYFDQGSLELEDCWTLPAELVNRFAAPSRHRTASSPEMEDYLAQRTSDTPATRELVREILEEFQEHAQHGRHPALVRAVGRLVGLDRINLREALEHLQESWDAATAGEGREREVLAVASWTIGQQRERVARRRISWKPKTEREELEELELALDVVEPLPSEFWDTEALRRVYHCAKQRYVTPEAFLAGVLVELLARIPPNVVLPDLIGTHAALNLYVASIAPSGLGKSTSASAARHVFVVVGETEDAQPPRLPLGSGQGIAESYLLKVGKTKMLRPDPSIVFTMDEGEQLLRLAGDPKSTMLTTLRMAWKGEELGAANASEDARRLLPALRYRLGVIVNFTPASAAALLESADVGTPQRFLFVNAQDFGMARREGNVRSSIRWSPPPPAPKGKPQEIILPARVRREIEDAHIERNNRRVHPERDYDAHRMLLQEKLAAPLALLDDARAKRYVVSYEDWERAEMFVAYSCRVRDLELEMIERKARRKAIAQRRAAVDTSVAVDAGVTQSRAWQCAQRIADVVYGAGEMTAREAGKRLTKQQREVFEDGVAIAVEQGWIAERSAPGQGERKRLLVRGARHA